MSISTPPKAPGTILQEMYLKRRLKKQFSNSGVHTFLELGAGNGHISRILLELGFSGLGIDMSQQACSANTEFNRKYIDRGLYSVSNENFFTHSNECYDVIISSNVIEHFSDELLQQFFVHSKSLLRHEGIVISLVPSSMRYWGIEDETAGHYRRFEYSDLTTLSKQHGYTVKHIVGLTFPVSNILFRLSNKIVAKHEGWKQELSKEEQTILSASGATRNVKYKSTFPDWFRYIFNEFTLYPFFLIQLMFLQNKHCMAIYCEFHVDKCDRISNNADL